MFEKMFKILKNPYKLLAYIITEVHFLRINLPDNIYIRIVYKGFSGRRINLKMPVTFNEKLQWLKLHDRRPEYTIMVDKYEAKRYVANIIGEECIIPTLGIWDRFDDIDFDKLPNQFVLKCTHDSGGLVICRDKNKFDQINAKKKIEKSLKNNYFFQGREWPYKNVKRKIIAEKFMDDKTSGIIGGLTDYKFYCFDGKPEFLYLSKGLEHHPTANISFVDFSWNFCPFNRLDYKPYEKLPQKPERFNEMIELAGALSKGIPFVRVDLYEIDGKVFFSELTFTPCSGMIPFHPEIWDKRLGEYINLPMISAD